MANHKSSIKRARQDKKRAARNKSKTSAARSAMKRVRLAMSQNNKEEAVKHLSTTQSLLAKLVKKGVVKKNTVARKISRPAKQIANLQTAPSKDS